MNIILKIAWRNIWRNKMRSLVVITSIMLGIWAGVFVAGFSFGLNTQRIQSTIENNLSHVQIHHSRWNEETRLEYWIGNSGQLRDYLAQMPDVKSYASRVVANGMVASAHYNGGARIMGIHPAQEAALTRLQAKVDSGQYFEAGKKNQVLIGQALAEKMQVKPGSRIVLTFTDAEKNIVSGSFKVAGLYNTTSSQLEKMQVFVHQSELLQLLSAQTNKRHEFALLLKNPENLPATKAKLQNQFPGLLVQSWQDLSPELAYADELMTVMLYVIIGIILLALSFGIINTMLMAVLERRKELGMLMGVGMSKSRVFLMILFETLMLSFCGGPLGVLLGYITIAITQARGLELNAFSDGLESFGISATVYPSLIPSFYWGTGLLVVLMAVLSSLYPARRALKLNPVEAIRTI